MERVPFAERLKYAMEVRGFRQVDLEEATGISHSKLSMYMSGKHEPRSEGLYKISRALDVNEPWLLGFNLPMDRDPSLYDGSYALKMETKEIPVLGCVCCGAGMYAEQNIIGTIKVDPELGDDLFALRIHGDSMSPRITDGDTVIVRKQDDAESGQIVIAIVNGTDGVCKKLVKHMGVVTLISLTPAYDPITCAEKNCKIIGRVVQNRSDF